MSDHIIVRLPNTLTADQVKAIADQFNALLGPGRTALVSDNIPIEIVRGDAT